LPIMTQIYRVIHEGLSPQQAVQNLFSRALKAE
jgi:glycerol-3-phosphate dehydrogenase